MSVHILSRAQAIAGMALVAAGVFGLSAATATPYGDARHRSAHSAHYRVYSSDVTVRKSAPREAVAVGHDAFHGPAAIITAPIEMAGTLVSLPFRAVEVVFPPRTNDPRVLIGAPVHYAGQLATLPFFAVNGAFGVRPTYYTYN